MFRLFLASLGIIAVGAILSAVNPWLGALIIVGLAIGALSIVIGLVQTAIGIWRLVPKPRREQPDELRFGWAPKELPVYRAEDLERRENQ